MKESLEQINQLITDDTNIFVDIEEPELAADAHEWFDDDSNAPQAAVRDIHEVVKACLKVVKNI